MSGTYCDCTGPCHGLDGKSPASHRGVPAFDSRPFHQGFVAENVSLVLVSVPILQFSPVSIATPMCQFFYGSTALVGLGRHIVLVLKLHPIRHTTHGRTPSGPVISSSYRPLFDNIQHSKETDIHDPGGIRTRNPSKGAAADPEIDRAATRIGSASYII